MARPEKLQINKVHFPVTTLGYGGRVGIWMQGCSIRCPDCISRDTWGYRPSFTISASDFILSVAPWLRQADGVTVSGGEPFDQPRGLRAFLSALRDKFAGDILVYSGYPHEKLFSEHKMILKFVDVLISEPFDLPAGQTLTLRGSDNQRIFLLTDLAKARYPADIDRQLWDKTRTMDVELDGNTLFMAGIPPPNAMQRLRAELSRRGFHCKTSDQTPLIRA